MQFYKLFSINLMVMENYEQLFSHSIHTIIAWCCDVTMEMTSNKFTNYTQSLRDGHRDKLPKKSWLHFSNVGVWNRYITKYHKVPNKKRDLDTSGKNGWFKHQSRCVTSCQTLHDWLPALGYLSVWTSWFLSLVSCRDHCILRCD